MGTILREQRRSSIIAAVVTIIIGVLLIFLPNRSVQFLSIFSGASLMVCGVIYIGGWLTRHRREQLQAWFLIPGIILVAIGLWLTTNPASVIVMIQYVFAAVLLYHGLIDLQGAFSLMRCRWNRWWLDFLLAIVTIGLGVTIFINPFATFELLALLIGLSLIFDGVSDLFLIYRLSKAIEKISPIETEGWSEDL